MSRYFISIILCLSALLSLFSCNADHQTGIRPQTLSEDDADVVNAHEIDISELSGFFDREGFYTNTIGSYFDLDAFLSKYKCNGTVLDTSGKMIVDGVNSGGWSASGSGWSALTYGNVTKFSFKDPIEGMTMPYGIELGSSISNAFERIGIKADAEEVISSKEAKQELFIYKSDSELLVLKPTLMNNEIRTYTIAYTKIQNGNDANGDKIQVTRTFNMDFKHKDGAWTLDSVSLEAKKGSNNK